MKPSQIVGSATEDTVDELTTGITYKYANKLFAPLKESIKSEEDSIVAEALESGINTLQFATMNAVINLVQEYAIAKLFLSSKAIYLYIKGSTATKKLKNKVSSLSTKFGKYGGALGKFVQGGLGIVIGTQEERLAIANMANNNVNNVTNLIAMERQNQSYIRGSKVKHFDSMLNTTQRAKINNDGYNLAAFTHKMKTGSWVYNSKDKKLYEDSTGVDFSKSTLVYNQSFVNKLNSFSEYAKDIDGQILNLAQTHIDYINTTGKSRVK